jgi:sentrin-specific protease 1
MSYLRSEWKDKGHDGEFDESVWSVRFDLKAPQQDNGSDCGVFSCQTLEAASRGVDVGGGEWEFDHKNMGFIRQMMIWEIAQGELHPRW